MSILNIDRITKTFANKKVLDNFSARSFDNEFLVLVGPSGCGKTTLLRIIAGLEKTANGKIYLDDKDITDYKPYDRNIAMVFQNYALYPNLTVFDNIAFPLYARNIKKSVINDKVFNIAKKMEISELLERKPDTLSGGQKQRVAIGRAMVREPKVFLFDEPLANLDISLKNKMRQEIVELHKKIGATFVYVTHDQVEAMSMGNRIIVMKDGKIQQIDTPTKVYQYPRTKFVAEFIGSPKMNFISSKLLNTLCPDIFLSSNSGIKSIGIRPEHISLNKSQNSKIKLGKVVHIEMLGKETNYQIQYDDEIIQICKSTHFNSDIEIDDTVECTVEKQNIHYYGINDERIDFNNK